MAYDNNHRFLLRLIASQSVLPLNETENLVKSNADNENVDIKGMIKIINDKIKPFYQKIDVVKDEITDEDLVVFISYGYDDTTKAQNFFTVLELEFFRLLMENIMTTETREIAHTSAISLTNKLSVKNKITTYEAKKLLNLWCRLHYLDKDNNYYVLGVRAIHEFNSYIKKNMSTSIKECVNCYSVVFRGYNCPMCPKAIHKKCLMKSLSKLKKWPCCKNDYNNSQLNSLRGQSSRLSQSSMLDTTQPSQSTQETNGIDCDDEVDTQSVGHNTSTRGRKRKRQENA